ncbi:MAG: mechanosensitive ion channel domain-containing protein [Candidatus Ozemobacteraceae bacterium]
MILLLFFSGTSLDAAQASAVSVTSNASSETNVSSSTKSNTSSTTTSDLFSTKPTANVVTALDASVSSSTASVSAIATPTPVVPTAPLTDAELTTYELTNVALSMLLKRVEVQESTLNAENRTASVDRLDPAAERASLERLLQQNAAPASGDGAAAPGRLEAAHLDLKILQSRRDLLQYRAGNLEGKLSELTERLGQNEADLSEGRRLEEEWRSRKNILDALLTPEKKPAATGENVLVEAKSRSLHDLLETRVKHLAALSRVRKLLQERMKNLREEQANAKEILSLASEYVTRFTSSLRNLEEQADRINLINQEKRAQEGLEQARRDQESLLVKLEELEKTFLESSAAYGTGSATSTNTGSTSALGSSGNQVNPLSLAEKNRRLLVTTQRDALLAARDAAGENIRHFELLIRHVKEVEHITDTEHRLASSPSLLVGDKKLISQLETLAGELQRDRFMAVKKAELLVANRRLLEQSARESEEKRRGPSAADGLSASELKEEQRLRRRQLASLEEAGAAVASQVATLDDLSLRVTGVRERLAFAQQVELERMLFARRTLRYEHGFPGSILTNVLALPGAIARVFWDAAVSLDLAKTAFLIVGMLAALLAGFALRRLRRYSCDEVSPRKITWMSRIFRVFSSEPESQPSETKDKPEIPTEFASELLKPGTNDAQVVSAEHASQPGETGPKDEPVVTREHASQGLLAASFSLKLSVLFSGLFQKIAFWLSHEAIFFAAFLFCAVPVIVVPSVTRIFALPLLYFGGRLLFTFFRTLGECIELPEAILEALLGLLRSPLFLIPPILVLHEADVHPEIVFLLEIILKLSLFPALLRLLPLQDATVRLLRERLRILEDSGGLRFFAALYRLFSLLLVGLLSLSILGYDNLTLWALGHAALFFFLFAAMGLSRPIGDWIADFLFAPQEAHRRVFPLSDHRARFFYFLSRKGMRLCIILGAILLLLHRFGLSTETPIVNAMATWFGANGEWIYSCVIRIALILLGVGLIFEFSNTLGESIITYVRNEDRSSQSESEKRASTLVQIFNTTMRVVTSGIAGIMILRELGMDITPLLTGAGIVGVAVGFGSQSLVKDFFAGFFILVENQFRVGDVIEIGTRSGSVEKINLKTTVLRGIDGSVHIIPNGEINSVRNMTYAWSRAVLDIGVAYDADVDRALQLMKEIGDELAASPDFRDHIIERPEVLGVESLGDSAVILRMLVKTRPLSQWNVARAFRKKILETFSRERIEIPFSQHVVTIKGDEGLTRFIVGGEPPKKG